MAEINISQIHHLFKALEREIHQIELLTHRAAVIAEIIGDECCAVMAVLDKEGKMTAGV